VQWSELPAAAAIEHPLRAQWEWPYEADAWRAASAELNQKRQAQTAAAELGFSYLSETATSHRVIDARFFE